MKALYFLDLGAADDLLSDRLGGVRVIVAAMNAETATKKWMCVTCGWVYDPDIGDPDGGIPPGTPFESIPPDWFCPVCGARLKDFEPYED